MNEPARTVEQIKACEREKARRAARPQLTVRQLIEQLQVLPPDATVTCEGCDCYNAAVEAVALTNDDVVIEVHLP